MTARANSCQFRRDIGTANGSSVQGLGRGAGVARFGSPRALDRLAQLAHADFERGRDESDCRPARVCLTAFDTRERGDGDTGAVGEIFLGLVAFLAQSAQRGRENLVGWS